MRAKPLYLLLAILLGATIFVISEMMQREEGYFGQLIFVETPTEKVKFNSKEWAIKNEDGYLHRASMLDDVIWNERIRSLRRDSLIQVLGRPDREKNNHLYYLIDQKRIGFWPMNTKTMVIKLNELSGVEWIKIHQ